MMNTKKYIYIILSVFLLSGCGKEFLEKKRDSKQVIPKDIKDYQAMLDAYKVINQNGSANLGIVGGDEYTVTDAVMTTYKGFYPYEANGYIWAKDVFETKESTDWNNGYQRILYANLVLEVEKIKPTAAEQESWNMVKGGGLFVRAFSYYQLAQLFCKPYDVNTAASDLGIPLKLSHDVTEKVNRGTVAGLYKQILADLETAFPLVPDQPVQNLRVGKAAVAALLARTYLQMGNYERAGFYADQGLKYKASLLDFKTLTIPPLADVFNSNWGATNPEIVFYVGNAVRPVTPLVGFNAEQELLDLYEADDLRLKTYFAKSTDNRMTFRGSYGGFPQTFNGITTAELWLMRAETRARAGQTQLALDDLNQLRKNRFNAATYKDATAANADEALALIVKERRKEFVYRGIRWEDLRRFNKEPRFAKTIRHTLYGKNYELPPNDVRYVWPIPDNEIDINQLPQNPR
ncbi:RagB/SusD family nutrient uptake outer membrane protein [Pedobacter sp. MC2016-24]|uniref:RagB/SusD family nutrient uptake outer membrane protein n=1 Tax=Pedobacter sp. MC2016-24 TaxID=2780090 RepID=UPI001880528B|nr:RagB/SusD family nutrient uptake outer membrane protein [Pedobacter sp. MC2016-24]MBE9602772.1 RagB/SusD family nutrient uptake outer membrane protein [Pedobacter sp. MC2016-24]